MRAHEPLPACPAEAHSSFLPAPFLAPLQPGLYHVPQEPCADHPVSMRTQVSLRKLRHCTFRLVSRHKVLRRTGCCAVVFHCASFCKVVITVVHACPDLMLWCSRLGSGCSSDPATQRIPDDHAWKLCPVCCSNIVCILPYVDGRSENKRYLEWVGILTSQRHVQMLQTRTSSIANGCLQCQLRCIISQLGLHVLCAGRGHQAKFAQGVSAQL